MDKSFWPSSVCCWNLSCLDSDAGVRYGYGSRGRILRGLNLKIQGYVFNMSAVNLDADQRLTQDLEKLTADLSSLVTGMVKPTVDILWFTWRMKLLTGRRGVAILYAYMLLGLGFLRCVTPDFGDLASREQQLEGTFRFMHERLRTHAESVAFFGGGAREKEHVFERSFNATFVALIPKTAGTSNLRDLRPIGEAPGIMCKLDLEKAYVSTRKSSLFPIKEVPHIQILADILGCKNATIDEHWVSQGWNLLYRRHLNYWEMVEARFKELLHHSSLLLKKKWLFGIIDEFITKQLPHNVTWGLSLMYAMEHKGDRALTSTQGELAHALRFLASVVSQSFLAFGDILELHKKFVELSGGINRIFELEEFLDAAQYEVPEGVISSPSSEDVISFSKVDIITPGQNTLARKLTCDIVKGKNLLLTGPNGSGKSSIFRVLRGLWPVVSGKLVKPCQPLNSALGSGIFYVPQRPYTCLGTLRDQIIYPLSHEVAEKRVLASLREGYIIMYKKPSEMEIVLNHPSFLFIFVYVFLFMTLFEKSAWEEHVVSYMLPYQKKEHVVCYERSLRPLGPSNILDSHLQSILENVKLVYLLEREGGWDANQNWEDILSLGEQQRLGMARLFFHKPRFGILDECTNATSVDVEEHLYRLAKDAGITVVTSSQRPALIPFHSLELRLIDGEGKWQLRSIKIDEEEGESNEYTQQL
ncbi:ABC transporter D family member 1 [Capsicum annuum]|nr:ABC transporter D family member 1 [Capsicum annuum]